MSAIGSLQPVNTLFGTEEDYCEWPLMTYPEPRRATLRQRLGHNVLLVNLSFDYNEQMVKEVKALRGRWNPEERVWTLNINPRNMDLAVCFLRSRGFLVHRAIVEEFCRKEEERK